MKGARVSCCLLDLDGTLTDPFIGISRCIAHALENLGHRVPADNELRSWIGPPLQLSFRAYLESRGGGDAERAVFLYRERFAATGLYENAVYPGLPEALADLKTRGFRLLLATAKPAVYARRIVDHFGLGALLDGVYGSELDGRRTDKTHLLAHLLAAENVHAGECIMIGDREHDMRAAVHHSMKSAGVLWGYGSARELLESGAERLLDCPADLRKIGRAH